MDSELNEIVKENSYASRQIDPKYSGIGGWLILVLIGLIITPIRLMILLINTLVPIFFNGSLQVLITPGTEVYSPLWLPLLLFETFGNLFFVAYGVVILVYFFRRKRALPRLIIIYYISSLALVLIDYFLSSLIPYVAAQGDNGAFREMGRSLGACLIWVPYFCRSKRVKSTFVN